MEGERIVFKNKEGSTYTLFPDLILAFTACIELLVSFLLPLNIGLPPPVLKTNFHFMIQ